MSPSQASPLQRVTGWGLAINLALSAAKFAVGWLANSQACIADGVHSLSDSVTDIALLVGVRFWSQPADDSHPHGHARIETLVVCAIGLALGGVGVLLGWQALGDIGAPHAPLPGLPVLLVALLSIGVKEWLYRWTALVGTRLHSSALVANAWHHRSDAFSSIPVAAAAIVGKLWPGLLFVDHLAAVIVSLMLVRAAAAIVWPALLELADAAAETEVQQDILRLARSVAGVKDVHGMRSRRSGPGYHVDLHVLVEPDLSVAQGHAICGAVRSRLLADGPRVIDVLIHLEPYAPKQAPPQPRQS